MIPISGTLELSSSPNVQSARPDCPECPERPYLRIFKSTVYVRDHERSLNFYVNQLGFLVLADVDFTYDGRWVAIAPPDGQTILALVAPKPGTEKYRSSAARRRSASSPKTSTPPTSSGRGSACASTNRHSRPSSESLSLASRTSTATASS